jgi:hypothetical protein
MLRIKENPTDPSNRRISILVKNDADQVPTVSAENVVNGSAPLPSAPGNPKAAESKANPQNAPPAAAPAAGPAVQASAPTPTPVSASAKPPALAPAPKAGLMDRLRAMLPGAKK